MRIASNKVSAVAAFFRDELTGLYGKEETEQFICLCFEEYLGFSRSDLLLKKEATMSESELLKFNFAVKDLKAGKPIQYILGNAWFCGMKLAVNEHVLIPRPETEEMVELIVPEQPATILDVGTGSGCIAIALKKKLPGAGVTAIDVSEEALSVAVRNARSNETAVAFFRADILKEQDRARLSGSRFRVIVSNPPYVRLTEKEKMHKNVVGYEPHLALFVNDDDPLLFYKAISDLALKCLTPDGKLYFEVNEAFGAEVKALLEAKGFHRAEVIKDISGKDRIVRAFRNLQS